MDRRPQLKDIPDSKVVLAVAIYHSRPALSLFPYEILSLATGFPLKICYKACERAYNHGLIECGVSLRTGWLTASGKKLLTETMEKAYDQQDHSAA